MAITGSYLDNQRPGAPPKASSEDHPGISSLGLILMTILVIGLVYGLCMLLVSTVIGGSREHVIATQKRILYATDGPSLLIACRQLAGNGSGQIDPASATVPGIIHRIDPRTITIADGHVILECGSGVHHFGVIADVSSMGPSTQPAPPMGVRELTNGLWYYAEDGSAPNP